MKMQIIMKMRIIMKKRILIATALLLAVSCAAPAPRTDVVLTPDQQRASDADAVRREAADGDLRAVRRDGRRFIDRYPGSAEEQSVRLLTADASLELGFLEEAAELVEPLSAAENDSIHAEALNILVEVDVAKGRFSAAADRLLGILETGPPDEVAARSRSRLSELVPMLSERDLEDLARAHPDSPGVDLVYLGSLSIVEARADTAAARQIRERLGSLDARIPPPSRATGRTTRPADVRPPVQPGEVSIGLLCPLSGRYAALGEEFVRGARIAVREARVRGADGIDLVIGDTRASSLDTRDAAVRLVAEERVKAIVGCILSSTTITAAQVAEESKVVLFSPLASEEGIDEIGSYVFQAPSDFEAELSAVVRTACEVMGLRRIAILAPDTRQQRGVAVLLRREAEGFGGVLCAAEYYEQGSTDFKQQIDRIRASAAEALFIPSDTEDLVLILPQLSFYEFGVQLLGTSAWNSGRLLRMAGRDMEGAVFPAGAASDAEARRYLAACVMTSDEPGEINRFVTGAYEGVRIVIEALASSASSGRPLREEMDRSISMRRHRFLELVESEGIPLMIVRQERAERFMTVGGQK